MKDPSFKCMLMISISDFFYLGINSYWFTFYCGDFYLNRYYFTQVYNIYLSEYFERCLAFYSLLVEIFLSGERYAVLLNKMRLKDKTQNWILFLLFIIALVYYAPLLLFKEIIQISNSNNITIYYELSSNKIGSTLFGKILPIVLTCFRFILLALVLPILNILNANEFRKRYKPKRRETGNYSKLLIL